MSLYTIPITASLYNGDSNLLDTYSYTGHAVGAYARVPDGTGASPVDISGWYILDNDPVGHATDIVPVAEGTVLNPGAFYVFDQNIHFTFGLGKEDQVTVFNKSGASVAEYGWSTHANGVYARIPDGTGAFSDFEASTKGRANVVTNPVVLNEVQSNDPSGGADWVELANPTGEILDISGIVIKDSDDTHAYVIPAGTTISANGFVVIDDLGFGLGKGDTVRLYENERMIASTTWEEHTNPTWGLYPDASGNTYRNTAEATPGAANKFAGIPEAINWPGANEVAIYDQTATFFEDSSGLDFYNGQLYAVDNGTGTFWILDVDKDGSMRFAPGFENGKRIRFQKDAASASAAGPDAEGITVDGSGLVYIAAERDNSYKGVNFNTILMVDASAAGQDLVALKEWDLTASLPQVSANMGIEAVEWVSNADVAGKLFDQNTNGTFDAANYPNAFAGGVFFVALEDNGHVYAYVLNQDGSSVQIADMDAKLGGAMALDFDTYAHVLWVAADNGYANRSAKITLNGSLEPEITHVLPAAGVDLAANNEGFAIADPSYTVNGQRPVYKFNDGVKSGALTIGTIYCDYSVPDDNTPDDNTPDDNTPEKVYPVLEGNNQTVNAAENGGLTVRVDGNYSDFVGVSVDGAVIGSDKYEVKEGSVMVTLKPEYIQTLSAGSHSIVVSMSDGAAEATFTVVSSDTSSGSGNNGAAGGDSDNSSGAGDNGNDGTGTDSSGGATSAPQTGDHGNVYVWIVLLVVSGCAVAIAASMPRKRGKYSGR